MLPAVVPVNIGDSQRGEALYWEHEAIFDVQFSSMDRIMYTTKKGWVKASEWTPWTKVLV